MRKYVDFANEFLTKEYGLTLQAPLKLNGRLTQSLGRHLGRINTLTGERSTVAIELSKRLVEHYTEDTVLDVLKHELVHYAMFTLNREYRDGYRGFENELSRLGISRTNVISRSDSEPMHHYACDCASHQVARKLNKNTIYTCKKCKVDLTYKGRY